MTSAEGKTARVGTSSLGIGVVGAVVGSVCCALPAAALALGLGGVSFLVGLSRYQPFFLGASLVFVAGGSWCLTRQREACCTDEEQRRVCYFVPAAAVGTYLVIYLLVNYVVVPLLYGSMPGME